MRANRYNRRENGRLYGVWYDMRRRCNDPRRKRYKDYGGRGIRVCKDWEKSFDAFADWAFSNGYTKGLTLERVDVNGNYTPKNCKWVSMQEQARNKRDTIWVVYRGERVQLRVLCDRLGVNYDTVHDRIFARHWSVEDAIERKSDRVNSLMSKCKERGMNYGTVRDRIMKLGWSEERALDTPTLGRGANQKTYTAI